ncbi:aminopeptidase P family protein [Rhodospirillum rubrum]|uniref:Peptidase M24 n=1 Tax=Rhodospirillum rubrum (strain ATCC 11170 / ATH 1.1.1 / DSM 467 / LMG 4362 / NCIMB 8255 / S1) TaxID=269796 RepID=Q2RQD3_RHORT|nr:aminopeptidase P family protein [Rhodospirillum rubrum]ABC23662.1 Peptidase M24 [Rhodospirillum rubrum ATCC 11170]AEO49400.1 peptidase M24 [Rhodospirillum rubrum F11]MBK5955338.1 Xaa-Pro aminopeptidase [Rhodospirillum rubrum]QXG79622.1 aminopeptidase P family protein [Rhodospirillum rubrum]HAQ00748.1 aminopeptidase P family protein [Rhodospirillum rubrum]
MNDSFDGLDIDSITRDLEGIGGALSPGDLATLVAGAAAAPAAGGEGWLDLIGAPVNAPLRGALVDLRARAAKAFAHSRVPLPERLVAVRRRMAEENLDGLIVPHADEYQNEFIPLRAERLAWLTGFSGSAGTAVVLAERAAIFVDGRYTLQVRGEVDAGAFSFHHLIDEPPARWLETALPTGARLGYDPWLHSPAERDRLREACKRAGAHLVALETNLLDAAWSDQPPTPLSPVVPHPEGYSGRGGAEKREDIAEALTKDGQDAVVLSAPDSIAWLFNIRGGDVAFTPLPLSYALLHGDGSAEIFVDPLKVSAGLAAHLGNRVRLSPPSALAPALSALGRRHAKVRVDWTATPSWIVDRLEEAGAAIVRAADPCVLPKAIKNAVELEGSRAAHRRDGLAMVRFLHWLSQEAPKGTLSELAVAEKLGRLRAVDPLLRGLSFGTISAAGPNAAFCHYHASPESDRRLVPGSLYLVDSGGQYLDGTTDITRTVAIGTPTPAMRRCFTLVLKGHLALGRARFPQGTTGHQLDALARQPLWAEGMDYDHGTGHGVGSFLGVHEGPARISKAANAVPLVPGMILSNEPGYYREGEFGIRIETLVAVRPVDPAPEAADRVFLEFETLTVVPLDRTLIDAALLDIYERAWVDAYHARVRETHAPLLDTPDDRPVLDWLIAATAPL